MCAGGQGGCVTSPTDCCQFYDVVTNMCINTCPAGSNTTDFICGRHAYIHLKLKLQLITIYFPKILVLIHLVKIKECVSLSQD